MGQVDAQAKFYRRLFGGKATPTLEDVPAHAVQALAAAFAYLATKDGWRFGPIPMGIWATVALVIFVGSWFTADVLLAVTLPEEARRTAMDYYFGGLVAGLLGGATVAAVGIYGTFRMALRDLIAGDAQPAPDESGPLVN